MAINYIPAPPLPEYHCRRNNAVCAVLLIRPRPGWVLPARFSNVRTQVLRLRLDRKEALREREGITEGFYFLKMLSTVTSKHTLFVVLLAAFTLGASSETSETRSRTTVMQETRPQTPALYRKRPSGGLYGTRPSSTCQLPDVGPQTENVTTDESTGQDHNEMRSRIQVLANELRQAERERDRYLAWYNAVRS